jgi:uncharacterized protein (DUF1778 family)
LRLHFPAFVLDDAKRQAEDTLKERTSFTFSAEECRELTAALDALATTSERAKVARLLAEPRAWDV